MKFGLTTPVVTAHPRTRAVWEEGAGAEELRRIAEAADRLGYAHLTCSEHVAIPRDVAPIRGARYYDPLATFGYLAAFTERIRLATYVVVLPYHHPLAVAKRYGTLDRISGGRLILGVGVGSLEEEFDLVGAPFADRGPRFEDALRALRGTFGRPVPDYDGSDFQIEDFVVDPCGIQEDVPIWIGGRSRRSLRRALELADGWAPFGLDRATLAEWVGKARETSAWQDRDSPVELVFAHERNHDVMTADGAAQMREQVEHYAAIGATSLSLRFESRSLEHYLESLERFMADIAPVVA